MKKNIAKTLVHSKHIDLGIEKYKGVLSPTIQIHLDNNNWNFTAYLFEDKRVMVVYPGKTFALLYQSEDALYDDMEKENNSNNINKLDNL